MRFTGITVAVQIETDGSWVVGGVSAGATTLPIENMGDFDEDGGLALIDDAQVVYTAAVDSEAGDYLTLSAPLLADVTDRTIVTTSPPVLHKTAMVDIGDGEVYECDVPSGHLWSDARLAETATGGQTVIVESARNGRWHVVGIPGSEPSFDAAHTAPGTLALESVNLDQATATNALVPILQATDLYGVSLAPTLTADDGMGNQIVFDPTRVSLTITRGNKVVQRLDADHSVIHDAIVGATQLTVDGTAELRGSTVVNPGGSIQLLSQVQPPPVPAVSVGWPFVTITPPPVSHLTSLTYVPSQDTYFYPAAVEDHGKADGGSGLMLDLRAFPPEGGNVTVQWTRPLAAVDIGRGICRIGTSFYVLVRTGSASYAVQKRNETNGNLDNQWTVPTIAGDGVIQCLGTDGTNLLIAADSNTVNEWNIHTFSPTGSLLGTITTNTGGNGIGVMAYLQKGTFDYSGTRIVLGAAGAWAGMDVLDSTGVEQLSEEWNEAPFYSGHKSSCGAAWYSAGGYFTELATDGTLYRYTGAETTLGWLGTAPYSAVITYRDAGTSETTMSPPFNFSMSARMEIKVTGPQIPPGADREALYLARVASPTRTDYYLQGTPAAGDTSWVIDAPTFTGAHPPATNTFPAGLSKIVDATGATLVDSTGYVAGGAGGGGGTGGVDIDCGTFGGTGVEIDCGGFV